MRKPLININVPKVGRITTQDVLRFSFLALGVAAAWNYSDRLPYVGPTFGRVKAFVRTAIGARVNTVV